ncbi:GNAT family N-acetyltransferase [Peribacillus huizhouensis]|uniref:Ribosomal protein S18 acetylase RimI-like enzyme n=1 Tax=Peribacillus huizhouensis TaxID=1501239 RepID=A0ABR6CPR6_9BACI|nr:GNAT family N-acetyltransferase [Peribacillus huizhouensis]MBA9026960.1 ribosomal protein S18 acetylase RimI-like enzyme [Peribacillus huizhouensis]
MKEKQLVEIEDLQKLCEQGTFSLKLNWDTLRSRVGKAGEDFFYYEGNKLVGYMAIYDFGGKIELCGMVHPHYRRQGIFTKLVKKALQTAKKREPRAILLNAPAKSESAKMFLATLPCRFDMAEYQMQWQETELTDYEGVTLRPSNEEDRDLEIQLDVDCFGFLQHEATSYYKLLKEEGLNTLVIVYEEQAVGKIRVEESDGEAWIYGFAITPAFQGKGIGRKVLKQVILEQQKKGNPIYLEVEATNPAALKLYESCGFKSYHQQDYYVYLGSDPISQHLL